MDEAAVELIEGPFDGAIVACAELAPFVWVDREGRVWTAPARGRTLYRQFGMRRIGGKFVRLYRHTNMELARCDGCGFYTARGVGFCGLCSTLLIG